MASLFSFNIHNRAIRQGLPLTYGRVNPFNTGSTLPPHLQVGDQYIAVNNRWTHPPLQDRRLMRASLQKITPGEKKPFLVFSPAVSNDDTVLVFIDPTLPAGFKPRIDLNTLNAYVGVHGEGVAVIRGDRMSGAALLECVNGSTVLVFLADGRVERLGVSNHQPHLMPLSHKEMAEERVAQFETQFKLNLDSVPRQHGILNGCLRLIKAVRDRTALETLVEFMVEHQSAMNDGLRTATRYALMDAGHPASANFLDGFEATNVIRIQSPEAASKRALADKKRRDRSAADRQRTLDTKCGGKGNGGGKSQTGSKKK